MLDKNLNLVVEVGDLTVHHQLVSYSVLKVNYGLLAKVSMDSIRNGTLWIMPSIAIDQLNSEAGHGVDLSRFKPFEIESLDNVNKNQLEKDLAFICEVKRLTNVIVPSNGTYEPLPLIQALNAKIIDDEQFDSIMSAVIFFIVNQYVVVSTLETIKKILASYSSQTTSLNCMDWINSLPKLIAAEPTAKKKA
jgi:hypothetical protein